MYCSNCGFFNEENAVQCNMCRTPIVHNEQYKDQKIYLDITKIKTFSLLEWFKKPHPIQQYLLTPFILAIAEFLRLFKRPLYVAYLHSGSPRFKPSRLKTIKNLKTKKYQKTVTFLKQKGFERIFEFEDINRITGFLKQIWFHKTYGFFAHLYISKSTGNIEQVEFFTATTDKRFLFIHNSEDLPITMPASAISKAFPYVKIPDLYRHFIHFIKECDRKVHKLNRYRYLILNYRLEKYIISQGLKSKIFRTALKNRNQAVVCYYHHAQMAVRKCMDCGLNLCEECIQFAGEQYYCKTCYDKLIKTNPPDNLQPFKSTEQVAGIGIRLNAFLLDLILIIIGVLICCKGVVLGSQILHIDQRAASLSLFIAELVLIPGLIYYFVYFKYRNGQTLGEKLWGIRYKTLSGQKPGFLSLAVQFIYHVLSLLFVFPLIAYIVTVFKRQKKTYIDHVSGVFPVTRKSVLKTTIAWITLSPLLTLFTIPFYTDLTKGLTPGSHLEKKWEVNIGDSESYQPISRFFHQHDKIFFADQNNLFCLHQQTGDTLWHIPNLDEAYPIINDTDTSSSLLIIPMNQESAERTIKLINTRAGRIETSFAPPIKGSNIISDGAVIVFYKADTLVCIDKRGRFRFRKLLNQLIEDVIINQGLLVSTFRNTSHFYYYYDLISGQMLWSAEYSQYDWSYSLGSGVQQFCSKNGKADLMILPEQKFINSEFQFRPDFSASKSIITENSTSGNPIFYSHHAAYDKGQLNLLFEYNPECTMSAITQDYLLMEGMQRSKNPYCDSLYFCNKKDGSILRRFFINNLKKVEVMAENNARIYLLVFQKSAQDFLPDVKNILVINKNTFDITYLKLPGNMSFEQGIIFPETDQIFVVNYNKAGLYKINQENKKIIDG